MVDKRKKEAYMKGYRQRPAVRARRAEKRWDKLYRQRLRERVLFAYGGEFPKCVCCSEGDTRFLTIDHVDGNGNVERKEKGLSAGYHTYKYLEDNNFPPGYQLLCFNCNQAKHIYGVCPHKKYA